MPALRPYQRKAVAAIDLEIGLGAGEYRERAYRGSTLAVQACGTGKSHLIGACTKIHLRRGGRRVLVTAPRAELLFQNAEKVREWAPSLLGPELGFELAEQRCHEGHRVIFASLASLRDPERLRLLPQCDLWLVDEGHLEVDGVRTIAHHQPAASRVGLTATPDRADLRSILPDPFEAVHPDAVFELQEAIRGEYLARIAGQRVQIGALAGLSELRRGQGGDFEEKGLSALLRLPEVVDQTARSILDLRGGRPTLVFACDLAHAEDLRRRLAEWGPAAEVASGELSRGERRDVLARFQAGDLPVLVTVVLLSYGWDAPRASCVALARPTRSRQLWTQSIGRGLRLFPGKEDCLVLDFWGGQESGLSLMTPEEALVPQLGGEVTGPKPSRRIDLRDEREIREDEQAEDERVRTDPPKADYRVTEILDMLAAANLTLLEGGCRWASTPAQRAALRRFGIERPEALDKDQATDLLGKLVERSAKGLCTLRQAMALQRKGLNPNVAFELASEALDAISRNGWRVPPWVRERSELRVTKTLVSRY